MPGTLKPHARDLDSSLGDEGYSADRIAGHSANRRGSQAPLSEQDAQGLKGSGLEKVITVVPCYCHLNELILYNLCSRVISRNGSTHCVLGYY